jgi:hypothetical protein
MNVQPRESPDPVERLAAIIGARGLITDSQELAPRLSDWRGLYER